MKTRAVLGAFAALLSCLAIGAGGCGGDGETESAGQAGGGGGPSGEPIEIGLALGVTGYLAEFDSNLEKGARLAVKDLNSKGGVLGRPVELSVEDMKSDPQQGVQATQRLITDDAIGLVNGFSSATTVAEAPIAERNQTPMIVASVLPDPKTEWVFSTIPPAGFETGVRIEYLPSQDIASVGILYDATPYAQVQLDEAESQLQEVDIDLVGVEKHATDATDLRSQLNSLLSKDPDAILKLGAGPTNVVAAKNMSVLGAEVPILMSIDDLSIFEQASAAYPQVLFAAAPAQVYDELSPAERPNALQQFIERYRDANLSGDPTYPSRGWDGVFLMATAIEKAGSDDGQAVRDALESMPPYDATTATYDFTADSHYGITTNPMVLAKIEGESVQIVYEPKDQ
jgi:branched-chain amino acid transport system substrate-binding protein